MKIRVQKTHNYTVMSNYHLQDRRLSYKAKGLLSFMLSVSDNWEYTIKGLATMAKDGVDSVATALKELEGCGYVDRRRNRNEKGQVTDTEYIVYEKPIDKTNESVPSETKNTKSCKKAESEVLENQSEPKRENPEQAESSQTRDTQPKTDFPEQAETVCEDCNSDDYISNKTNWEKPVQANPILDKPVLEKPEQENPAQINKNIKNTKEKNKNLIISYQDNNDTIGEDYQAYEEIIKENICYDDTVKAQCNDEEMKQVDFMVQLMAETMVSTAPTVRIGKNDLPIELVKSRFMKIWYEDIFAVLQGVKESKTKIKYFRNYYLTALYYADHTENIKVQQIFKNSYETEMPVNKPKTDGLGNKQIDDMTLELFLREMEEQDE
ncbi:MAG: helix-turn-helix domain-containing protein [Clostridiales bacterium]|nr:helix-turn-helix domain-containing protein [Clostridiales bacterium]